MTRGHSPAISTRDPQALDTGVHLRGTALAGGWVEAFPAPGPAPLASALHLLLLASHTGFLLSKCAQAASSPSLHQVFYTLGIAHAPDTEGQKLHSKATWGVTQQLLLLWTPGDLPVVLFSRPTLQAAGQSPEGGAFVTAHLSLLRERLSSTWPKRVWVTDSSLCSCRDSS